jgi:hypothetical protein
MVFQMVMKRYRQGLDFTGLLPLLNQGVRRKHGESTLTKSLLRRESLPAALLPVHISY